MTDVMTHRGPNDRGVHLSPGIAIGVRRLSIVDVAGGHQPFSNETSTVWAAQNGELYNHGELRTELRPTGIRSRACATRRSSRTSTSVYGTAMPQKLRGKFAFVVWDEERGRAVVARDRLGVKPLYYGLAGDLAGLRLGAEERSRERSRQCRPRSRGDRLLSLARLLRRPVDAPRGGIEAAAGTRPGRRERSRSRGAYWELPFPQEPAAPLAEREYVDRFVELLDEAVRLRLMSDVPLGAMLSGGLDSSVVVALMARHSTTPVKTFSVAFSEDAAGNELDDARLVASTFGTEHHEIELSLRDESISLEELVWHLDEPLADLSSLGLYALSKLAAEHVTVALSGQGADELLGGYPSHRNAALADRWARLPGRPAARTDRHWRGRCLIATGGRPLP